MRQLMATALAFTLCVLSLAAAGEEGTFKNLVDGKVNFNMKYDPSFGGIYLGNADFVDYVVEIDWVDGAVHLGYTTMSGHDGNILPAGKGVTMPVRPGAWRIVGDNGHSLPVNVQWGTVTMVRLEPVGGGNIFGMEAKTENAAQLLMTEIERQPDQMPRKVEPPEQTPPAVPFRHPFGIRSRGNQLLDYMREHDPEKYAEMRRQFEERFPDRKLSE